MGERLPGDLLGDLGDHVETLLETLSGGM